ncbi:MAG: DUF4337 domain-containing protein [Magnetococcus sp. YQC-3]
MADTNSSASTTTETNRPEETDPDGRFNLVISTAVTVLATLLGIFNVKDGNITQAMSQEQSKTVDSWAYYQAKSTKQHVAENTLNLMRLEKVKTGHSPAFGTALDAEIAALQTRIEVLIKEKEQIKKQAEDHEKNYDALNYRDDQFDIAEAGIDIGIAMLGVSGMTRSRWMALLAGVFGLFGAAVGLAGFFELPFHPNVIAQWLS